MDVIIDEKANYPIIKKDVFNIKDMEEKDWKKMSQNANREWDFPIFQTSYF